MGRGSEFGDEDALMQLALNDPVPAIERAQEWLADPTLTERHAVVALRARGLARRQLGELSASEADLREALDGATAIGDNNLAAAVGLTLGGTCVQLGRVDEAIALVTTCVERSDGEVHAEAIYQLGTTHAQAGDLDTALELYEQAYPLIQQAGRVEWHANLLGNRGTMQLHRGDYDAAVVDLDAAIDICRAIAAGPSQLSLYLQNKAYALHLRGDIAESLDLYAEAEAFQREHGLPTVMFSHKCNAYLSAGMYEETMALAQEAHRFHRDGQAVVGAIEALLPGAEAALALDNTTLANQLASAAIDLDTEGSFPVWRARARLIQLDARLREATSTPSDVGLATELHGALIGSDGVAAVRSLTLGAEAALHHGDLAQAADLLSAAAPHVVGASHHVQMAHATVRARVAAQSDDSEAVLDAAAAGFEVFDDLVGEVHHYDVRFKASRLAEQLVSLSLPRLIEADRLAEAIATAERARAGSAQLGGAATMAAPHPVADDEAYLVYFEVEDRLVCLVQRHDCIDSRETDLGVVTNLAERHAFDHRQLAHRRRLGEATVADLADRALETDHALADALLPADLPERLIINPSPGLGELLWAALPGLDERSHVVAPARFFATRRVGVPAGPVAVLGTTDLDHVPAEVAAIAEVWGVEAQIDPGQSVLSELAGVGLLHAAGHFVNDSANPLLSMVPLGELRLRGHEYLTLDPPPAITVLSACASGRGDDVGGAQVGFASAALAAGTATIVVTQTLIEDSATVADAMTRLHELLRDGQPPAEALRIIRGESALADRSTIAALAVVGTGW